MSLGVACQFSLGGPILKDKLWFYLGYGKNDINIIGLTQQTDQTILKNLSTKQSKLLVVVYAP